MIDYQAKTLKNDCSLKKHVKQMLACLTIDYAPEWGGVKKCQNFTFKVKFQCQKLSEPFSFFFVEEYHYRSTFFVIDIS